VRHNATKCRQDTVDASAASCLALCVDALRTKSSLHILHIGRRRCQGHESILSSLYAVYLRLWRTRKACLTQLMVRSDHELQGYARERLPVLSWSHELYEHTLYGGAEVLMDDRVQIRKRSIEVRTRSLRERYRPSPVMTRALCKTRPRAAQ